MTDPVDELRPISELGLQEAVDRLEELGEHESAELVRRALERQQASRGIFGGTAILTNVLGRKAWAHAAHTLGFIHPASPGSESSTITHAGNIASAAQLRDKRLRLSLYALRVAQYPGRGTHRVLLHFSCQNQRQTDAEQLHFNATYRVADGDHAGVIGQPIFDGVRTGEDGLAFRCVTINVKNDEDERLISFLDGDAFKRGLQLVDAVQPALAPFVEMARGLARGLASRSRNVPVQDVQLGLDFGRAAGGARLAIGSYVAVQIPERQYVGWDWSNWVFDHNAGRIVLASDRNTLIPYNYLCFGVEPCRERA